MLLLRTRLVVDIILVLELFLPFIRVLGTSIYDDNNHKNYDTYDESEPQEQGYQTSSSCPLELLLEVTDDSSEKDMPEDKGECFFFDPFNSLSISSTFPSVDQRIPSSACQTVMATSSFPHAGWGIFTLVPRSKHQPIFPQGGDLVLQLVDVPHNYYYYYPRGYTPSHKNAQQQHTENTNSSSSSTNSSMRRWIHEYVWNAEETGGQYEGMHVWSCVPGVGSLANGLPSPYYYNALPFVPTVSDGGVGTRAQSPGAGAVTHYHNFSFYLQKDLQAGTEVILNYGQEWFQERSSTRPFRSMSETSLQQYSRHPPSHDLEFLYETGFCLDNLRPGTSKIQHAGRGAFADRELPRGSIVLPVPVMPISHKDVMNIVRKKKDGSTVHQKQLMLNYCLGHSNSSLLLYPYGPFFGLVNHHTQKANVKLQWSAIDRLHQLSLKEAQTENTTGLMELVAIRDIAKGEEILLDYGKDFAKAWQEHAQNWKPVSGAHLYIPSYVQEDVTKNLRTEAELKSHPYPENLFTSCFYRYSDNSNVQTETASGVLKIKWKLSRGLFELQNLRPCSILSREQDANGRTTYTVQIRNRPGLSKNERLPRGSIHIVSNVPRSAIRFSDLIYTTDQHLENAFRYSLTVEGLYPESWMDLSIS